MFRNVLVPIFLAMTTAMPVLAAPILLVEMNYKTSRYGGEGDPPVRDREFGFSANQSFAGPPLFEWFDVYGVDDVGKTFPAPDPIVECAALALGSASTSYRMFTAGLANPSSPARLSDMPPAPGPCSGHPCAKLFVADPTAYRVTRLDRVIDDLFAVRPPGFGSYIVGGNQLIRFWGEPIPPVSGDFNRNGSVDSADYVLWRNRNGTDGSLPNESGLTPLDITQEDYDFWRANYGRSSSAASIALSPDAVPEPSSRDLVLIGLAAAFAWLLARPKS